jgi:hypothetical protein
MRTSGVCYDVGRVLMGQDWRPMLDVHEMRRELEVIGDDLHCNAVRICGQDVDRLVTAGEYAWTWDSRSGSRRSCGTTAPRTPSTTSWKRPNGPRSSGRTDRARWSSAWAPS